MGRACLLVLAACSFHKNDARSDGPTSGNGDASDGSIADAIDGAPGTTTFGSGTFTFTIATPTAALAFAPTTPYNGFGIDTGACTATMCSYEMAGITCAAAPTFTGTPLTLNGVATCLFAGAPVSITGLFVASGSSPIVVASAGAITTTAADVFVLAAANPTAYCGSGITGGQNNNGGGGGAGGSFISKAGDGGKGNNGGTTQGKAIASVATPDLLRGGCNGGTGGLGGAGSTAGVGGLGGGAAYFAATGAITIDGRIDASGWGGGPGQGDAGGGGGGGGGMVVFWAQHVDGTTAALLANGAGGGGGGGGAMNGQNGASPGFGLAPTTCAGGGAGQGGGNPIGGTGACGAANASNGSQGASGFGGCGGGGGDGSIRVLAPTTSNLPSVSPAATS